VISARIAAGLHHLAPDIDGLPFVDRRFLADDPYRAGDGRK
jgi:anaerobic magnesium-protoporphyrin IX monomethyl ester cyclase